MDPHRLAEERSLALHRAVVARLRSDPHVLSRAQEKVERWVASGAAPHYARAWQELLAGPLEAVCALLVADTQAGRAMRQATPFAGAVAPRERWRIWARAARDASVR